ncbi:MAG: ABC transporter ATP-binding protein [Clostridia bacterium]|nr:ABC transporter ATP-binding protein [Clostridia bacterium]
MEQSVVFVRDLTKTYGEVKAVDGISFTVRRGSLFAFLGVNGAGKSTTINILCGALTPTSGEIEVCGYDVRTKPQEVKKRVGIVFQDAVLDAGLSVIENLSSRAALYGYSPAECKARVERVLEEFRLTDIKKRPYGKLSGGQRRRVDIARALMHDPELLFLDEPTTGLDPATRELVWELIDEQRKKGLTVFLTTHYMEESARAEKVVVIDEGKVIVTGSPEELKSRYASDVLRVITERSSATDSLFDGYGMTYSYENGAYEVRLKDLRDGVRVLQENPRFSDFEIKKGTMDDVFLRVTGKTIGGGEDA